MVAQVAGEISENSVSLCTNAIFSLGEVGLFKLLTPIRGSEVHNSLRCARDNLRGKFRSLVCAATNRVPESVRRVLAFAFAGRELKRTGSGRFCHVHFSQTIGISKRTRPAFWDFFFYFFVLMPTMGAYPCPA